MAGQTVCVYHLVKRRLAVHVRTVARVCANRTWFDHGLSIGKAYSCTCSTWYGCRKFLLCEGILAKINVLCDGGSVFNFGNAENERPQGQD